MEHLIGFIAGASFGATSVVVGQPLDTIKTRMQAHQASLKSNPITVASEVFRKEGLRGLYRGGFPILVGGATFRSAQFGVYAAALGFAQHTSHEGGAPRISDKKLLGCINPQVVFAGFWGGVARGVVEGPFEYIKVCRQINVPWRFRKLYQGSAMTIFRNSFLFGSFVIYLDLVKQAFGDSLGAFWTGALCANAAWLTIWPLDVVKTQIQSGNYKGVSAPQLVWNVLKTGQMFRGVLPGLMRSTIANGCSMVVYKKVEAELKEMWLEQDA